MIERAPTPFELRLGYVFKEGVLLERALTHKSYYFENLKTASSPNEVLEFLGDAVIDLGVSSLLIERFPQENEGVLYKVRAFLVNERDLSEIALALEMQNEIRLGRGESSTGGHSKPRLLASAYEAVLGAVFQEAGFNQCFELLRVHFENAIQQVSLSENFDSDYKTRFQEMIQAEQKSAPTYILKEEFGPAHEKVFVVEVQVQGQTKALGQGRSKKQAEQDAARLALIVCEREKAKVSS